MHASQKWSAARNSQQHLTEAAFKRADHTKQRYTKKRRMEGDSTSKCGKGGAESLVTQAVRTSVMILTTGESDAQCMLVIANYGACASCKQAGKGNATRLSLLTVVSRKHS